MRPRVEWLACRCPRIRDARTCRELSTTDLCGDGWVLHTQGMVERVPGTSLSVPELMARARMMLEENQYLTLATADSGGEPWSTTVWYCTSPDVGSPSGIAVQFIWLSMPESRHSKNLMERSEVGISIFNSTQPAGTGDGLQFAARATLADSAGLDETVKTFSRASLAAGGGPWTRAQVEAPARPRLYVATATQAFVLANGGRSQIPVG